MIIKIEDAPSIKNIKIDINFDSGEVITSKSDVSFSKDFKADKYPNNLEEIPLDLDQNFKVNQEIVEKPIIPDLDRQVEVSSDMTDTEF